MCAPHLGSCANLSQSIVSKIVKGYLEVKHIMFIIGHSNMMHHDQVRTHLVSVLRGDVDGFCNWQGIKCSTWVAISRATTLRSFFCPLGNEALQCVREGNLMASRLSLILLLVVVLGGKFVVEQPASSLLWRHPRLQWLCQLVPVRGLSSSCILDQFKLSLPSRFFVSRVLLLRSIDVASGWPFSILRLQSGHGFGQTHP